MTTIIKKDALTKLQLMEVIAQLNEAKSNLFHVATPGDGHAKQRAMDMIRSAMEAVKDLQRDIVVGR